MKKYINDTKNLIKRITRLEEMKYSIPLDVNALTRFEYAMSTEECFHSKFTIAASAVEGYTNAITSKAFVFVKDIPNFKYVLLNEEDIKNLENKNKSRSIIVTYHEIRHVIQKNREDLFSNLDLFAFKDRNLFGYEKQIGGYNHLYSEIDANLYAYSEVQQTLLEEGISNKEIDIIQAFLEYCKNMYDYEMLISTYSAAIRKTRKRSLLTIPYWNRKGEYRKISDIIERYDVDPFDPLAIKILTSNDFLSKLDIESLSDREKKFMDNEINLAIQMLQKSRQDNEDLYFDNKIDNHKYEISNLYFNSLIENKLYYRDLINKKEKIKTKI